MTETTKPVVSQADWLCICGTWNAPEGKICQWCDAERVFSEATAKLASHSSPDEPVAWMYEDGTEIASFRPAKLRMKNTGGWTETPLYTASAIEAAQLAARNAALEEAASIAMNAPYHETDVAEAIAALRTTGAQ